MSGIGALVILWPWLAAAPAPAAAPSQLESSLDNGLHVLVRSRPERTLVTLDVIYAAGAAAEPDSLAGLAHLTEHLLCKGEPRRRLELLALASNASTSTVTMTFTTTCLPSLLPQILDVEVARMAGVPLDSLVFAREQSVVLEELAYRGGYRDTSPRDVAFRTAFPGHPYGRSPGGTPQSVRRIGAGDVRDFVARAVHPGTALIVVDGPVDPQAVVAMVSERFGPLPAGPPRRELPPYPDSEARQSLFDNRDHKGYRISAVVRVPLADAGDLALADLATAYLAHAGIGADLATIPYEGVVSFNWYGDYFRPDPQLAGLYPFAPDQDIQRSLAWHWDRIVEATRELDSEDRRAELEDWLGKEAEARRTPPSSGWLPGTVLRPDGPLPSIEEYARLAAAVTLGDIRDFLVRFMRPGRTTIAVSHGHDSERLASRALAGRVERHGDIDAPDALDGLAADQIEPVLAAYGAAAALPLTMFRLGNGVPVVCRELPDEPEWTLHGWRHLEPVSLARLGKRPGICRLYEQVAPYDPRRTRDGRPPRPWRHDAEFGLTADGLFHYTACGPCADAADVASALIQRLEEKEFNVARWAAVLDVGGMVFARVNQDADARATGWRWSRVLGEDHPALATWRPDPQTLADVKYKELEKLHGQVAATTGATYLLACGCLPVDSVRTVLEASFGRRERWSPRQVPPPPAGPGRVEGTIVPAPAERDVNLTLTFAAVSPETAWAQPGLMFMLLEELLARTLDSRLRQKEGWTYGAACRFVAVGGWAVPEISVTCQPGQAPAVLAAVREELADLAAAGISADELALARLRLAKRLLRSGDDGEKLAAWLRYVSAFGPAPEEVMAEVLALDPVAAGVDLGRLVPADRLVFSATGAILEDDLDLFTP